MEGNAQAIREALESEVKMSVYLEMNPDKKIIADIKAYGEISSNIDRTKIATAALQGFITYGWGSTSNYIDEAVKAADLLIKKLKETE